MAPVMPKTLMARAVAYLARREHSRLELARKLSRYLAEGESTEEIDRVLDRLQEKGFLSDQRYAHVRARVRSQKYGNVRLAMELRAQGVDNDVISQTLENIEEPEIVRAQRLWDRRFGTVAADYKERARQIRFLASRGFSMNVIAKVVKGNPVDDWNDN